MLMAVVMTVPVAGTSVKTMAAVFAAAAAMPVVVPGVESDRAATATASVAHVSVTMI